MNELTHVRLLEVLEYDPLTGDFTRKLSRNGTFKGAVAGTKNPNGYIYIWADSRRYLAHRLAWFYVHACWPELLIDHINGVKTDNRIANLRDADYQLNGQNTRGPQSNSTSKFRGVSWHKKLKKWGAKIQDANGRQCYLGWHDTEEAAGAAYLEAKRRMHRGCTI